QVESSFNFLEIYAISIESHDQLTIETDRQIYSLSLMSVEDLEAVVCHVAASLKKIFPDSSPWKLLKKVPPDLQERLWGLTSKVEEQLNGAQRPCGGFSDTYAALCDFNDFPCREEVQWDVNNIYHVQNCREFNLLDFSHLESRDLALAVGALSFNQWFTKIYSKDFKLTLDVQEQVIYLISRSTALQELSLEASGLKIDFAVKMACALHEQPSSALRAINLSSNAIEDKGVIALSQIWARLSSGLSQLYLSKVSLSPKGLGSIAQVLHQNKSFSKSLTHLDLSGNAGCLATEDAMNLFNFLSAPNVVSHLDLSSTDCPLDTLFVSLSAGCYTTLTHLNLSRNTFSHRKVREVTRSVRDFFTKSMELKYVGLSGTRLLPEALRLLLQGLATNSYLSDLELDISSCELKSSGAQVIQDHIFEAKAICSLDLSDNGFENDMVTLVLSIGRSHSIRHLALGRNFAMKSRALTDVLHRIVQLIQEEECPLESLSVSDSKLKTGTTILINSLGSNSSLSKIDISGNFIGDTGAKMLAKALIINTKLKTLVWDRNNVTASGFMDVANALERNTTLQHMSIPMSDMTQSYRTNPEKTEEAMRKIQTYLWRNSQKLCITSDQMLTLQQGLKTSRSEQLVQNFCQRLQETMRPLACYNIQEVQSDILSAEEALQHARTALIFLPRIYELGRSPSAGVMVKHILDDTAKAITSDLTEEIQEQAQAMLQAAQSACPRVVQRTSVSEQLANRVANKTRQAAHFVQNIVQQAESSIIEKLSELKLSVSVSLVESIIEEVMQDLSVAQQRLEKHLKEYSQPVNSKTNVPQLRVVEQVFPTDEYVPVIWRNSFCTRSIRPAPSVKSLLETEGEQQARASAQSQQEMEGDRESGGGGGGGGGGVLSLAMGLSVTTGHTQLGREVEFGGSGAGPVAARSNREPRRSEPSPPQPPMDLPSEGHTLRHYTRSRPRPNRHYRQPPSKPQEQAAESENEVNENIGRVDEGVEEFFTKKIIPDDPLKHQREDPLNKAQSAESAYGTTSTLTSTLTSSTPSTATTKNIKKKFGDFFAFKKVRAGRGAKSEGAPEVKVKKTSIADLIRPLREAARAEKEREKEKERDKEKEREKEKEKEKVEEESLHKAPSTTPTITDTSPTVPTADNKMAPTSLFVPISAPIAAPSSSPNPSAPSPAKTNEPPTVFPASPLTPTKTPSPVATMLPLEGEKSRTLEKSRTPDGERRPKATRRSLREGKSQSLILLTGLEPGQDSAVTQAKKHSSESSSTFEQRLHVMLHRMGVAKTPPFDSKKSQSKDEELRKANSEGAILDSQPEPPPMKPRTMSTSSDTRRPVRAPNTEHPPLPERPIGPLPPKPTLKPTYIPPGEVPVATRSISPIPRQASPLPDTPASVVESRTSSQSHTKEPPTPSPRKETPPAPSPRRVRSTDPQERAERAQSVTEETLPKPWPRMKPSPQRRAVSVHEDALLQHAALLDPEELKAALPRLQRSPIRKRVNLGELEPCSEDLPEGEEAKTAARERYRGQAVETDSTTANYGQPEKSLGGMGEEETIPERGASVSEQHTAQGESSDQRTETLSPETYMD
ncbi:F-actin-uncapping protein RLTPR, partial [Silurus asotus]